MSTTRNSSGGGGGIKGFLERAHKSFQQGFDFSREWSWWLAQKGGSVGLFLASTSMVVLLPLIFEINREAMVRHNGGGGVCVRACAFVEYTTQQQLCSNWFAD
jgi:hypothetical protein